MEAQLSLCQCSLPRAFTAHVNKTKIEKFATYRIVVVSIHIKEPYDKILLLDGFHPATQSVPSTPYLY